MLTEMLPPVRCEPSLQAELAEYAALRGITVSEAMRVLLREGLLRSQIEEEQKMLLRKQMFELGDPATCNR